jgi:Tfp pilus assembly PilM family ATPase
LLDNVCSTLGVTLEQAQYIVDRFGLVRAGESTTDDYEIQSAVTDAAGAVLEELTNEIRRTIRYLEVQRSKLRPSALWILGGGACIRNLAPYIEPAIGLPVRIWDIPREDVQNTMGPHIPTALLSNAVALSAMPWSTS